MIDATEVLKVSKGLRIHRSSYERVIISRLNVKQQNIGNEYVNSQKPVR